MITYVCTMNRIFRILRTATLLFTFLTILVFVVNRTDAGSFRVRRTIGSSEQGPVWQLSIDTGQNAALDNVSPLSATITTVDTDLYTGYENAIYAQDDNTVFVAYKRFLSDPSTPGYIPAELRLARSTDAGQTWTISVLDPNAIEEGDAIDNSVSIDGDGHGTICVAYLVQASGLFADMKLTVAKSTDGGASWAIQTVANGYAGDYNSIRVLSAKAILISAHANGPSEGIHTYITQNGGANWTDTLVAGTIGNGYYTSIGAANSRSIWVSYYNSLYPDHQDMNAGRRFQDGSWANFLVDNPSNGIAGLGSSITVTANHVAYAAYEADTSSGAFVKVASSRNGIDWNIVSVQSDITIGWNTAIHEANGELYVSYWRLPNGSRGLAMFALSRDGGLTWKPFAIPDTRFAEPYIDSTAPSDSTQFESYQTVDPVTFQQPFLQVARIGK